jgi:hypothetical protein
MVEQQVKPKETAVRLRRGSAVSRAAPPPEVIGWHIGRLVPAFCSNMPVQDLARSIAILLILSKRFLRRRYIDE